MLEFVFSLLLRFWERLGLLPADRDAPDRPHKFKRQR
jgi:hypothetical protein